MKKTETFNESVSDYMSFDCYLERKPFGKKKKHETFPHGPPALPCFALFLPPPLFPCLPFGIMLPTSGNNKISIIS